MADPIESAGMAGSVEVPGIINATEISRKIQKKLIIWTTFSVLIGSFPILLNLLILFAQNKPIYFFDLFAHGELLLISIAIAAGAMGDMIYCKRFERVRDIAAICICFIIILFSISWFASLGIGGKAPNAVGFGIISIFLFIATVFVSGNCEAIVEVPNAI